MTDERGKPPETHCTKNFHKKNRPIHFIEIGRKSKTIPGKHTKTHTHTKLKMNRQNSQSIWKSQYQLVILG